MRGVNIGRGLIYHNPNYSSQSKIKLFCMKQKWVKNNDTRNTPTAYSFSSISFVICSRTVESTANCCWSGAKSALLWSTFRFAHINPMVLPPGKVDGAGKIWQHIYTTYILIWQRISSWFRFQNRNNCVWVFSDNFFTYAGNWAAANLRSTMWKASSIPLNWRAQKRR